jgi:hydrogenase nickel incorporation protein HypB
MCATCGCSDDAGVRIIDPAHGHGHTIEVSLEQKVLARNDELASVNRQWLAERQILALNLMSSPGSGKTTLLEHTLRDLAGSVPVAVIEGDQETVFDADRIRATGSRVVQINTGAGCHLDAAMLASALHALDPEPASLLFIENVGNLVCPALFDLGETHRVVITSVTEGADKPLKYPHMFRTADLVLLNKIDLLPYVPFEVDPFLDHLGKVNPEAQVVQLSAIRGDGLPTWHSWLRTRLG